jgi:hypothetical protein
MVDPVLQIRKSNIWWDMFKLAPSHLLTWRKEYFQKQERKMENGKERNSSMKENKKEE